jgi:hypothetical protein
VGFNDMAVLLLSSRGSECNQANMNHALAGSRSFGPALPRFNGFATFARNGVGCTPHCGTMQSCLSKPPRRCAR